MRWLYADENFPLPAVEELRRLGCDVLTMSEDGTANQSVLDAEVLSTATEKHRALLTTNRRHFIQLHRQQPDHSRHHCLKDQTAPDSCAIVHRHGR